MDYLVALLFWCLYEALSWPMRLALAPVPMRGDLRRMISRVGGPPVIVMVAWVSAHFLVPLGFFTCWIWFALFMAGGYFVCRAQGQKPDWAAILSPISVRRHWRQELFLEGLNLALFFIYLTFRRMAPEMTFYQDNSSAAEKFPNAMFFWSSWNARWLPPDDYWLSGVQQAYYYWGHFFWAWIGRMGHFPGEWVITLALSRVVALTWEACYLLVRAFGAGPISAAIGAFFLAWGGDPKAVETWFNQYNYFSGRLARAEKDRGFPFAPEYVKQAMRVKWDFGGPAMWEPSRVIANTVNEFPSWSMVLGDFHAHHLALPWMTAWLAIILAGDRWFGLRRSRKYGAAGNGKPDVSRPPPEARLFWIRVGLWTCLFITLAVATSISNLWVAPLVGAASFGILLWHWTGGRGLALRLGVIALLAVAMVSLALLSRGTLSSPLPAPVAAAGEKVSLLAKIPLKILPKTIRSTLFELFLLWGFQVAALLFAIFTAFCSRKRSLVSLIWLAASLLILAVKILVFPNETGIYWLAFAPAVVALACTRRPWISVRAAVLVSAGCLVLAALEWIYIPDRFDYPDSLNLRYNTYFKLCYPVWPILGAAAWMVVQRIWKLWRWGRLSFSRRVTEAPFYFGMRLALLVFVPFVMTWIVFGMPARIMQARIGDTGPRRPTLDAFAWLANRPPYAADAELLEWIRKNVPPRERVAEAAVPSAYSFNGRVASLGGRPVPLGWSHHEEQWRGVFAAGQFEAEATRKTTALYEAQSPEAMRKAAEDLGVRWVVFGKAERDFFGAQRGPQGADHVYQMLCRTAKVRAMFPADRPQSFIFEMGDAPETGAIAAPATLPPNPGGEGTRTP